MQRDIRDIRLYREVEQLYEALRRPGSGLIVDAADLSVSPDGEHAAFTGTFTDTLAGVPQTRICEVTLASGATRVLTFGPNTDRLPKYSSDGSRIAFLSDRHQTGDFQLYLLDRSTGAAQAAPRVPGWVEYLHWSPDGRRVLLGVAGHGADTASAQGATATKQHSGDVPSWMPMVDAGDESFRWRSTWIFDLGTDAIRRASPNDVNIWEAAWCGDDSIAVVASRGPEEGHWYQASLHVIDLSTDTSRALFIPEAQLGCLAGASNRRLAFVEALCSDRGVVAGSLLIANLDSSQVQRLDTQGVDITYLEWRSQRELLIAGHRGFDMVVGLYDASAGTVREVWASSQTSSGSVYAAVAGMGRAGDCALVGESFFRAPEIAVIRKGEYRAIKSFDVGHGETIRGLGTAQQLTWKASDGLDIQGWLLRPADQARPGALVMNIHGGPVSHWRPRWLGRAGAHNLMLLAKGYAVFLPNPRGSSGRGQAFARAVLGDIGGADAGDCLSGIADLVTRGIADPARLGVTGGSYGGFMTCWLITQDARFAAAVALAPHTNHLTEHLLSNIPHFMRLFLGGAYHDPAGKYFQRNPVMHAYKARTPALNICGALDRCTPAEEAKQFHRALLDSGVESVLVSYPEEGHGIRRLPAAIDYAARLVGWFEKHMPARAEPVT